MGQISQPQHKNAAAGKIEILEPSGGVLYGRLQCCSPRFGKCRHWSSQFWRNRNKILIFRGVLDPSYLEVSLTENCRLFCFGSFKLVWFNVWIFQIWEENIEVNHIGPLQGSNIYIFTSCSIFVLGLVDLAHMLCNFINIKIFVATRLILLNKICNRRLKYIFWWCINPFIKSKICTQHRHKWPSNSVLYTYTYT